MSDENLELARRSFEAWGARDAEWFVENTTEEFEFVPAIIAGVEGQGGAVRGADAIRQFFADLDEPWESFVVDEGEYREVDDQVVCVGRLRAKGRGSGVELDQETGWLVEIHAGKMTRFQAFLSHEQALAASGLS